MADECRRARRVKQAFRVKNIIICQPKLSLEMGKSSNTFAPSMAIINPRFPVSSNLGYQLIPDRIHPRQ